LESELAYWHDLGHGQVRENLGWISHLEAARGLLPFTRGVHIHDALPPMDDHLAPGKGSIDFETFSFYGADGVLKVFEPGPQVTAAELAESLRHLKSIWGGAPAAAP
jgi:sugar phosphate isomerase/epimerase